MAWILTTKRSLGDKNKFVAKYYLGDKINRRRKHPLLNVKSIRRQKLQK